MHLFPIPQHTIQNRNVHISVLNGVLWDMEQVRFGICEVGLFISLWTNEAVMITSGAFSLMYVFVFLLNKPLSGSEWNHLRKVPCCYVSLIYFFQTDSIF